jgi:hypothetical protein
MNVCLSEVSKSKDYLFHKEVIKQRSTLASLNEVQVRDGYMTSTNLSVYVTTPTDLPDGTYRLIGSEWVKGTIALDDMPEVLKPEGPSLAVVYAKDLLPALERALSCVADSMFSHLALTGILLDVDGDTLRVVGTDTGRMSLNTIPLQLMTDVPKGQYIIEPTAASALLKSKSESVHIGFSPKSVSFFTPSVAVVSRLFDSTFPDYKRVIPGGGAYQAAVNRKELLEAIKSLGPYFSKKSKRVVRVERRDGELLLTASDPARELEKTVSLRATIVQAGPLLQKDNLTLIMPYMWCEKLPTSENFGISADFLKDVADNMRGQDLYWVIPNSGPHVFYGEPIAADWGKPEGK